MNRIKYFGLLMLMVFGAISVNAQGSENNTAITLERTACHGTCPIYTVTILDNGAVNYTGEQTTQIDPATVQMMLDSFAKAGYFDRKSAYDDQTVSDLPTVITSVTRNGHTHQIARYSGDKTAPLALPFLEQWIDEMANTALWTGVQPDVSALSNGGESPLVTLQRDACFGRCPVYTVALFQDGTGVYTGIANVKTMGVQIFKTDGSSITSITQKASAFHFFDWQDNYEQRSVTDQATITTSIRTDDQFKRIVRYDGDPAAPLGLVRIEDSIDQLVTDWVGAQTIAEQDAPSPTQIGWALNHLSAQVGQTVTLSDLQNYQWSEQTYSDASLGCPAPGTVYAQMIAPAYQFLLTYQGKTYDYRVAQTGSAVQLCGSIDANTRSSS